jgi:N-acetylmuramoyl-L-alanine amidase
LSSYVTKTAVFLFMASVIACGNRKTSDPAALLKHSTRLLDQLSHQSGNTIPDAVLNRTKCLVAIPGSAERTQEHLEGGLATCRRSPEDEWDVPELISFERQGASSAVPDRLIFILQDTAKQALQSGRLRIPRKHAEAPLVSTNPIPSQLELSGDWFAYEYSRNALSGSRAVGVIEHGADGSEHVSDRHKSEMPEKLVRKYLSSVTSFFNTIVPTGIVIHHTSILPGENTLPRNEHEVDKYHESRGFKVTCFGHVYHVAYHYLILPNGRVQEGRPERCEGAHAQGYNSYLGISLVGDFSSADNPRGEKGPDKPTQKQLESLVQLCRRLRERYNIPLQHILRHSDISRTRCPGDRFPFASFLQQLQSSQSAASLSEAR